MPRWFWLASIVASLTVNLALPVSAQTTNSPVTWRKTVIEQGFRSEGVAVADVNKDGRLDLLIGDAWYEAPAWKKHEIRKAGNYGDGLKSYSECMMCWADDVNQDGWVDQIVIGFPGKPAYWYENPKGKAGHWPEYEISQSACNETPLYLDLFQNGQRVLIMGAQPAGKDNEGQMFWFSPGTDPRLPWEKHAISEPSQPKKPIPGTQRFAHGLGVGDLNRDGRLDVICTGGWWEQPSEGRDAKSAWSFHRDNLGDAVADIVALDVNQDGLPDLINSSAHRFGIWWYEQVKAEDGGIAFKKHDLFPNLVSETHALIAIDINGDGHKDFVTGKRFWSHGRHEAGSDQPALLYWFEAQPKANAATVFVPREVDNQSGIGTQFEVRDFNGDQLPDIITANKKGVFLFEQVGTGASAKSVSTPSLANPTK